MSIQSDNGIATLSQPLFHTKEEQARAKAEEKDRIKAKKLEREKIMRESKRRRKVDMEKMDEAKLKDYLGGEINRLEREKMVSTAPACCKDAFYNLA